MFSDYHVVLEFKSYIDQPMWPETNTVINIRKASGCDRVRSEAKRESSLKNYLEQQKITVAQWEALVAASQRPWYTNPDGKIYISSLKLTACLVAASYSAPSGAKIKSDSLRSFLQVGDFITDKTRTDRIFGRFVQPKDGKGNPLSNQRAWRENDVIDNFTATGTIAIDVDIIKEEIVKNLLTYAGKHIGVGASRKMSFGRFTVKTFEPAS